MQQIAVVILNWNGSGFLERFLPGVVEHSKHQADIVVADNGSTDHSKDIVAQHENVQWLPLDKNYGFAEGYNRALSQLSHPYFVILNSDVEVRAGWLDNVLNHFGNDDRLGALQPKLLDQKNPPFFEYAGASGGFIDIYGFAFCRGRIFSTIEEDKGQYNDVQDIFWSTGACMIVRSDVFKQLNGFDQDFFAHYEEIDLCWRIKNAGYRIICDPSVAVYHVGGGTLGAEKPYKTFLNFRNSLLMLHKNLPSKKRFRRLFVRLWLDGLAANQFLFTRGPGHWFAIMRAHFAFYANLGKNKRKRTGNEKLHPEIMQFSIVKAYYLKGIKTYSSLVERLK